MLRQKSGRAAPRAYTETKSLGEAQRASSGNAIKNIQHLTDESIRERVPVPSEGSR
ncbi:Uncharacterized protein DBV15_09424 [Temnothorax longispinosus]|uniref:Uncharacterized protein n=1 Tax=Temnothorax longispinosus TaxID=300112 RepID=A0A4S2L1L7_9HYME|nr:Uncharacterized protein DBV15_09424 [Temnothorax longispinosus]